MSRRCRHPIRVGFRTILVLGAFALGGCGQSGALYLPSPKAKHASVPTTAAQAATSPAPATR